MDLVIQFPGYGMIPGQRRGSIPQFFVGTATEKGAIAFLAHREVMQNLQHVKENCDRYGEQHNGLERAHHLEQPH